MSALEESMAATPAEQKPFRVDFIDPLFAIALNIGIVELLQEQWFADWRWPREDEVFDVMVFLLGLTTIIASWVGYHQSIRLKPLRGLARFVLDVLLVLLYAVILVKFADFEAVLSLLVVVFILFFLWDLAKIREYPNLYDHTQPWRRRYRREGVTVLWMVIYAGLWIADVLGANEGVLFVFAYVGVFGYRLHKKHPVLPGLDGALFGDHSRLES